MRTAKDNSTLSNQYYRPEQTRCPHCQWKLKRSHTVWRKYLTSLSGRSQIFSQGYRCPNPACPEPEVVYRSAEVEKLSVPDCSYGLDVIVEVGYQRFWYQRTIKEIHQWLEKQVLISERQVLNLLVNFLALLRATQPIRLSQLQSQWRDLDGLVISIDGMQPEKGNPALYVVREIQLDVTLMAEILETADHQTIATTLLKPIASWSLPVKGIVSDAQESIRLAAAQVWPDRPHQNCQFHCLKEAGRPTFEADRALKTSLKKKLRGRIYRVRQTIKDLPDSNPYRPVLLKYVQYLRFTLLARSLAPFELGGLRMVEQLMILEASLDRSRKKGAIGC